MKKFLYYASFIFISIHGRAQWNDSFTDGNFTSNPQWYGNPADWVVNTSSQLQSNNVVANTTFHISTSSPYAVATQWEFYSLLTFNPSSNNWVDVFVTASDSNLQATSVTGYFIRLGNTDDDVCLYRKDANGSETKIIDGINGALNTSANKIKVKLTRKGYSDWNLLYDLSGTGSSYTSAGNTIDSTYRSSAYFGIKIKQSTSSFFQKHFFDDIVVQPFVPDIIPPRISAISVMDNRSVDIFFNEPVSIASAQSINNYQLNNTINPATCVIDGINPLLVHIQFSTAFAQNISIPLRISNVQDIAGNTMNAFDTSIYYYVPGDYDIIINELMADPTPQVQLPNAEWIELKNKTRFPIDLKGWIITDATHNPVSLPTYILKPDSVVILTSTASYNDMRVYGPTVAVPSFPSLNNDSDSLFILSPYGKLVSFIAYNTSWYRNATKMDGGWSLELMDDTKPCIGAENWTASIHASGGTPGQKNSFAGNINNLPKGYITNTIVKDSVTIVVFFSRPVDTTILKKFVGTPLNSNIIKSITIIQPAIEQAIITLDRPLEYNSLINLSLPLLKDCSGILFKDTTINIVLPKRVLPGDWIINEVLFNPKPTGHDYVEFYNNTNYYLDVATLAIATRNNSGTLVNIKNLSSLQKILPPGEYIVVTTDAASLTREYFAKNEKNIIELPSLPAFSNDEGIVIAMDTSGTILDELHYFDKWHHELLSNTEGVSLERVDPGKPTNEKTNWHSAASLVGYGTPTYENSQVNVAMPIQVKLEPAAFSPDGDGYNDYTTLSYVTNKPGFMGRVYVYDINGRLVKTLFPGGLTGTYGNIRWDGKNDHMQLLPIGNYILYIEFYNTMGEKFMDKKVVTITKKL